MIFKIIQLHLTFFLITIDYSNPHQNESLHKNGTAIKTHVPEPEPNNPTEKPSKCQYGHEKSREHTHTRDVTR